MAFKAGKSAFVLLDNVAGTPVDVSAYAGSAAFPQPIDTHDVSVFGVSAHQFIPGLTDGGQFSLSGPLDVGLGTFVTAIKAAQAAGSSTTTITYAAGGSVAGQLKQSAEAYIASFDVSTDIGSPTTYQSNWQITGLVTNGTW